MGRDGRILSPKNCGGTRLEVVNDLPSPPQEAIIAAWESNITNQPSRCVVRCDGYIQNWHGDDSDFMGYPCAVLRIDYSIGGFQVGGTSGAATSANAAAMRSLYVDCVNQSAIALWATSIEVVPVWDQRRIDRLTAFFDDLSEGDFPGIARTQMVAAAISVNDWSAVDGRWLDVVSWANVADSATGVSVHPIPPGARACRILNATDSGGDVIEVSDALTAVQWASYPDPAITTKYIHQDCIPDCNCALDVPAGASYLFLRMQELEGITMGCPFWIEWLISPKSL